MRIFFLTLFLIPTLSALGQKPGYKIERSPDGRYLRLQNKVITSSFRGSRRDLTIYDFEANKVETVKQVSPYGGHSPGHIYQAYSQHSKDRNKHVYKNQLIDLSSGRKSSFSDDHLVLQVFDDGKILATKPGFDKYGNVKSQLGLYMVDPKSGKKTISILGKKDDAKAYLRFNQQFTDDLTFSFKLKGNLEVHNLQTGEAKTFNISWPEVGFMGSRLLLEASEKGAVLRATHTKDGKRLWYDYFFNAITSAMTPIGDHTKSSLMPTYEMFDGKLYSILPEERAVKGHAITDSGLEEIGSWIFNSVDYRRDVKEYQFALASETRLAVIHFTDGLMQLIDLANDRQIDEVGLFRLKPSQVAAANAKKPASSQPLKKVYKSVFLNSFDPLSLGYRLDYNTVRGRAATRPNGQAVSAIGLLGNTESGDLIVLMMRRYNAQGAEIIRFQVAVYDEQGKLKGERQVGFYL